MSLTFCALTTAVSRVNIWYQKNALSGLGRCPLKGDGSVVIGSLLIVTLIVGFCIFSTFCYALSYVLLLLQSS